MFRFNFDVFWHNYLGRPYRLHVTDHGGDGPVIILLHGIAASSANWNQLIPLLQANYHCISIDLIGFGDSPKPQWYGYTIKEHVRAIRQTIKRLHMSDDYTLMGHSLGSLLATRYASLWPGQISRLILLSPPVYAPLDTITSKIARQRTALFLKLYKFLRTHPRMTPDNFKRLGRILPLPISIVSQPETWIPFMRTLEQCIEQQTIIADIAKVQAPVDIFYGTLDQVVIAHNLRTLPVATGLSVYAIRGVNHDISKRYAAAVTKFLS